MENETFQDIEKFMENYGWFPIGTKKFECPGLDDKSIKFYTENNKLPEPCNACYKALIFWEGEYSKENITNFFNMINSLKKEYKGKFNHNVVVFYFREKEKLLDFLDILEKRMIEYSVKGKTQWRRACKEYQELNPRLWKNAKIFFQRSQKFNCFGETMKILAFSGLHGNKKLINIFIKSLRSKELKPDVFVCAGDIGDSIIVELFSKLLHFNKPIIFVLGNHTLIDNDPNEVQKAENLSNIYHLKENILTFDDYQFIGQDAWTHFCDDTKFEKIRFKDLTKKFDQISSKKSILKTHHAPLGILDQGISYPEHSWKDKENFLHGGSLSIRKIVMKYKPTIHLFAHCHSDGGKWEFYNDTLFVNVCHLERATRSGDIGINGSFMIVDTDTNLCIPHHLTGLLKKKCSCGAIHYLNYDRCFNCYKRGKTIVDIKELKRD